MTSHSTPCRAIGQIIELSVEAVALGAMAASPGDPSNGVSPTDLMTVVPIDIAYGGSCTGGRRDDLRACCDVLALGLSEGCRVAEDVRAWCERQGYADVFRAAGVTMRSPGPAVPRSVASRFRRVADAG